MAIKLIAHSLFDASSSLGINHRYATIAAVLLLVIWLWVALDRPYKIPAHIYWNTYSNRPVYSSQPVDAFNFDPIESEAIRRVCEDTEWNEGLVFTCDESVGGVGNVRNSILNCVRYTISGGAALVLPSIVLRDPEDISKIRTDDRMNMAYMFDVPHFVASLSLSCPGLRTFHSVLEIDDYKFAHKPIPLLPESLVDRIPTTGIPEPETWRGKFEKWLDQYGTRDGTEPIIVHLGRSYLQYPIYSDGEDFAHMFGNILKFRADVRMLATNTLLAMSTIYDLPLDLNLPIIPDTFFGCHLRTEKDAVEGWPSEDWEYASYASQASHYLNQAARSSPAFIYVASGDYDEISRFKSDAASANMNVTTKFDLLAGEDLKILDMLAWDQQAMVDFLVLLKSSNFGGVSHSSFAWNIALKRHLLSHTMDYLDGAQMLSDESSQIYGVSRAYPEYADCLWP